LHGQCAEDRETTTDPEVTQIAKIKVLVRICASSILQERSYVYTHRYSDGLVGMLYSAVWGYRTQGNIDVKKTLTKQTIRQYFFRQICL